MSETPVNKTRSYSVLLSGLKMLTLTAVVMLWAGLISAAEPKSKSILVLNSYHPGYTWSDDETFGIIAVFKERGMVPFVEYLDTKNNPDLRHYPSLITYLKQKYQSRHISLVLTEDNHALEFGLKHRPDLFPDAAIVFCGVNDYTPQMIKGYKGVTGVAEVMDVRGTIDLALRLQPDAKKVFVIHDYTLTGIATRTETKALELGYASRLQFRYAEDMPFHELLKQVEKLPSDHFVVILSYATDKRGTVVSHGKLAGLISARSNRPVYAIHEARFGHGIVGGSLMGGYAHGQQAAKIALEIWDGKNPDLIPVETSPTARLMVDYSQIKRFSLPAAALPPGTIIISQPESLLEKHLKEVVAALIVVLILISMIIVMSLNIRQRHRVELQLRRSEEQYRGIFNNFITGIFQTTPEGGIIDLNPALVRMFGYDSPDEMKRMIMSIGDQLYARQEDRDEIRRSLDNGEEIVNREVEFVRKDGNRFWASLNAKAVRHAQNGHIHYEGTVIDITDRKKAIEERFALERQMRDAQRLESLGIMAGGIAHDFNNLLTAVLGYTALALVKLPDDSLVRKYVSEIEKAATRAADLSHHMLLYTGKGTYVFQPIDINGLIMEIKPLMEINLSKNVSLKYNLAEDLLRIKGDPFQIRQAVLILITNASEAIGDENGFVYVSTNAVKCSLDSFDRCESFCRAGHEGPLPEGMCVLIEVSDTGCGMDSQTLEHIFDPFFSTKFLGRGLGLAALHGIVKGHNGIVEVDSEVSKGTTFRMFFPGL